MQGTKGRFKKSSLELSDSFIWLYHNLQYWRKKSKTNYFQKIFFPLRLSKTILDLEVNLKRNSHALLRFWCRNWKTFSYMPRAEKNKSYFWFLLLGVEQIYNSQSEHLNLQRDSCIYFSVGTIHSPLESQFLLHSKIKLIKSN